MSAKVADASVLAAILFNEPRAGEAASIIADARLFEPLLLANELASVCRKKALAQPDVQQQLLASLELGLSADIEWVEVDQVAATEIALFTGLTTYDATYVWLARMLQLPLLTFDEQLRRRVSAWPV